MRMSDSDIEANGEAEVRMSDSDIEANGEAQVRMSDSDIEANVLNHTLHFTSLTKAIIKNIFHC
jgi:hypothetical protein